MANPTLYTISGTSPGAPGTTVLGNQILGFGRYTEILVQASLLGATGGALDVYLQWTPDGANWYDYVHFAQLAAAAAAVKYVCSSRVSPTTAPIVVGTNLTPALAVATCVGGPFGMGLRAVCVAGAGTTVGAALSIAIFAK